MRFCLEKFKLRKYTRKSNLKDRYSVEGAYLESKVSKGFQTQG